MDLAAISAINGLPLGSVSDIPTLTGTLSSEKDSDKVGGNLFGAFLNTAVENIRSTNGYLSDAENEYIRFLMGETESTHDLTIALQKGSTALQYTVAIRDKVMDAYKEIMQMQI